MEVNKELDVAVRVVQMACSLCRRVQMGLVSTSGDDHFKSKDDDSPVTVAGTSIFYLLSIALISFSFFLFPFFFFWFLGIWTIYICYVSLLLIYWLLFGALTKLSFGEINIAYCEKHAHYSLNQTHHMMMCLTIYFSL